MGINSFWETLNDEGECVNLFEISSKHIQKEGMPYRIAVDTPYWLFKNLDEESVEAIRRTSHRASNPNEKAILYRLMRFACHGIQVCLVFDGPGRPVKRGKELTPASHALIDQKLLLLKEAAQNLGVMCWNAPAEAEAECANMMRLGIVDAVWSEDSDVFLFRGETLLRFHYAKPGHKDNVMARLYHMSAVTEKLSIMDWRDVVFFAVLVGGDYSVRGLPGCGPRRALEAVRKKDLGPLLIDAFKRKNLQMWRQKFQKFLHESRWNISLPDDFPNVQVLKNYIEPQVSSLERLRPSICWDKAVEQPRLKILITTRFNFSVQEYIRWVVRLLISRRLLAGPGPDVDELKLQFIRDVSTKESGNIDLSRVSFLVSSIVPSKSFLENWPIKDTIALDRIKPYVHEDRIECDLPDSIIRLAIPELLKGKKVRVKSTTKFDQRGEGRKLGRPRNNGGYGGSLDTVSGNQEAVQAGSKRKRGVSQRGEAEMPSRTIKTPRQKSLSGINRPGGDTGMPGAQGVEGGPVKENPDSDEDFPDLVSLVQRKRQSDHSQVATHPTRSNDMSGASKTGVVNEACHPGASHKVQGEGRAQRQRGALSELASHNARKITSESSGRDQQKVEGLNYSQAIELTSD